MHIMIKTSTEAVREAKTLIIEATNLKTKTNLTITGDEQSEFFDGVTSDVKTLGIGGLPLGKLTVTVEGAPAMGRLFNRSLTSMGKLGLSFQPLVWEAGAGVVEIKGSLLGSDLPALSESLLRLMRRATQALSHTQHPLSLYDMKQAMGIIIDIKDGSKQAQAISDWFDSRELVQLEALKEKAKADRIAAKAKDRAKRHKADPVKILAGTAKNSRSKSRKGGTSLTDLR